VHVPRMILPALVAGCALCLGMILFNDRVLPESNHELASLIADISRKRPTTNIEPGRFVDDYKGYSLLVGQKDEKSNEIRDVQIYVLHEGRVPDVIVAPRGQLEFVDGGNTLQIDLFDGEMHSVPSPEGQHDEEYRVTRFAVHTVMISDVGNALQRTEREYRSDREMSIEMMRGEIAKKHDQIRAITAELDAPGRLLMTTKLALLDPEKRALFFKSHRPLPPGRLTFGAEERQRETVHSQRAAIDSYEHQIRQYQVEIQKKYSIPVACIVFVLLGAALAIRTSRGGMAPAISFSLSCFFVYYWFLTGGEKLADRELLSPFAAMWAANVFFTAVGVVVLWRASIDSTPIAWQRFDPRRWWPRVRAAVRGA
jgi:lipopolysaccharide export system permease protein